MRALTLIVALATGLALSYTSVSNAANLSFLYPSGTSASPDTGGTVAAAAKKKPAKK